jgi:hypothetical protein
MAAPTLVAVGPLAFSISSTSVNLPSGILNDDLLLMVIESANEPAAAPGIWLDVPSSPQGTGTAGATDATRIKVLYRWYDGTTPDTTITDVGNHFIAQIFALRGVNKNSPFNASAGSVKTTASTSATYPSVTTTEADCLVLLMEAHALPDSNSNDVSGYTNAALSSITEITDVNKNTGNGGGFSVASGIKAVAGSTGTSTSTTGTSSKQAIINPRHRAGATAAACRHCWRSSRY